MESLRVKEMFKYFHFATFLLVAYALFFAAHSQGQSGFISLDCGLPENSNYTETTTEINYISDAPFISSGKVYTILPQYKVNLQYWATTVRSFPDGTRNCYTINTERGTKYLMRAWFLYGNYDGKNSTPEFDLHLGPNFWDTVKIVDSSSVVVKEIIHFPLQNYVRLCLVNTGSGTPFISALELRPLKNTTYKVESQTSLALAVRIDVGSNLTGVIRYPYDVSDRIWVPYNIDEWKDITTSQTVDSENDFQPPHVVMNNAAMPANKSAPFRLIFELLDPSTKYYLYMHFAELQQLKPNESRAFNINVNGRFLYGPLVPTYLLLTTVYSASPITGEVNYTFTLDKLENSTLPPIVNAIEIYALVGVSQLETDQDDVDAMVNIKSNYGVKRNWDGDPCVPLKYLWAGLNCSNDGSSPPRITSLDLSSSGLTGEISTYLSKLTMLESLDLSNNNLTGSVPNFLSQLPNLRVLNLGNNKLTGLVPAELIEKSSDRSLSLSVEGNQNLCASSPCKKKKKSSNIVIPVAASVGGLFIVLLIAGTILMGLKARKKQGLVKEEFDDQNESFDSKKRKFTYSEVIRITNNFKRVLGKGGFGTVYHGFIDEGSQVAVKIISLPPIRVDHQQSQEEKERNQEQIEQQYKQFEAEVKLLLTVYHGNLTSLVGYFKEGANMGLIYEYMANGDLESHLSGRQANVLSWETRLEIAIDAAQGLDYLHHGCKPPIIHRDVKTANILLNENFRAKLADFGLSRFFSADGATHVSTRHIAGTPGYLDPDITNNSWLNEKSDVYSFGVVILQIITARPAISRTTDDERTHISEWVDFMLSNGDVRSIVDLRLQGDFEINSMWKAVEIAMACLNPPASRRPNMSQVVIELRECLASELTRRNNSHVTDSSYLNDALPLNMSVAFSPVAR
ncbi:LRR receptor-like serine/threonine-protein kinase IOS1 isoform X1 [Morus notabilis]|uniref:LRR receptor-like serine/threonine-protein kinase IOS1 isoform X1 n=1 Tax=Morus notabilis TaxID=981085 RepID=UPI000CED370E|nr:LRR receptor-like serine/threonine-protein kinase IOS1 isoform X1 [Morus notabilis]